MSEITTREMIRWTDAEILELAQGICDERARDPFASIMDLFKTAQGALLEEHRHRDLPGLSACQPLRLKVAELWKARMDAKEKDPEIIHVETQRPPDYIDMLQQLDTPSLMAMLVTKIGQQMEQFKPLLTVMNGAPKPEQAGAPLLPPVSLLAAASAKPRKTRVLIIGPLVSQFREIEAKATEEKLAVELQYLDKDKNLGGTAVQTDHVIVTKFTSHSMMDNMKASVPKGRFHYLEGGITVVVQKLRDIAALLPPRA